MTSVFVYFGDRTRLAVWEQITALRPYMNEVVAQIPVEVYDKFTGNTEILQLMRMSDQVFESICGFLTSNSIPFTAGDDYIDLKHMKVIFPIKATCLEGFLSKCQQTNVDSLATLNNGSVVNYFALIDSDCSHKIHLGLFRFNDESRNFWFNEMNKVCIACNNTSSDDIVHVECKHCNVFLCQICAQTHYEGPNKCKSLPEK